MLGGSSVIVASEAASTGLAGVSPMAMMLLGGDSGPGCNPKPGPTWEDKYPGPTVVRRPNMGLQLKGERQAYFQIVDEQGKPIPLYNGVGGYSSPAYNQAGSPGDKKSLGKSVYYTDFLITRVDEQRAEKVQIIETFGEGYFYSTGQRPRVITVYGYLLNSKDFAWRAQFWENYETYLRGTRLLERKAKAYFGWDDILVGGYLMGANANESAENSDAVNFSFSMIVADYVSLAALMFDTVANAFPRRDISAASERNIRGSLDIMSGGSLTATSRGMRTRQRLASMGILGAMLQRGMFDTIAELINDPQGTMYKLGADFFGKALSMGNDLTYEGIGKLFNLAATEPECLPLVLTGKTLAKEWWQDASGWITVVFDAAEKVGAPIPHDVRVALSSPLEFLRIAVKRNFFSGNDDIGPGVMVALGAIGFSLFALSTIDVGLGGNTMTAIKTSAPAVGGLFPA